MAEKECSVFIVDLGKSMGKTRHDRDKNDLDWSLQYLWDKITNIVYLGRKTLVVGVIGLRTDRTKNHMMQEDGYENITILQDIRNMLMPELQELPPAMKPSNTDQGDALSAVILAVDMIIKHCRHLQFKKQLYLITNGTGQIDGDDIESTAAQIKKNNIQLTVLGVDFDDAEYGFKEENKPHQKAENEKLLKKLVEASDGVYATMQEAVEGIATPYVKHTRPVPTYKGQLRLGGQDYDTAITIDVERYFKVMIRRPPTASSYVIRDAPQQTGDDGMTNVKSSYTYSIKDDNEPSGKRDVPREELAKGYEYGRTAVHISESDENITKLETTMGYEILGFIPVDNVERYMVLDNTSMLIAQKGNDKAAFALSSLIHALFELESCAVARFVKKDMSEPQLTLLSPHVTESIECLIENDLPFAEDVRQYRFPPIDKIFTASKKTLTSHRNLPDSDLLDAMSSYVDSMSLMSGAEERLPMEETFSPLLHTIEGAIKYRAVHPNEPLPPKSETLLTPSRPPADLLEDSKNALQNLIKAADVKKVPPKAKGRRRYREAEKPLSGLDVDELLNRKKDDAKKSLKIDPENAIPEFKRAVENASTVEAMQDAVQQMFVIIENLVKDSFGDQNYNRAVEALGVVRQEMFEYDFVDFWNEALKAFKKKVMAEELGGNRREFWWKIRTSRLGLITSEQSDSSKVSKEDAYDFLASRT